MRGFFRALLELAEYLPTGLCQHVLQHTLDNSLECASLPEALACVDRANIRSHAAPSRPSYPHAS
jgi:hypothetical protein